MYILADAVKINIVNHQNVFTLNKVWKCVHMLNITIKLLNFFQIAKWQNIQYSFLYISSLSQKNFFYLTLNILLL